MFTTVTTARGYHTERLTKGAHSLDTSGLSVHTNPKGLHAFLT